MTEAFGSNPFVTDWSCFMAAGICLSFSGRSWTTASEFKLLKRKNTSECRNGCHVISVNWFWTEQIKKKKRERETFLRAVSNWNMPDVTTMNFKNCVEVNLNCAQRPGSSVRLECVFYRLCPPKSGPVCEVVNWELHHFKKKKKKKKKAVCLTTYLLRFDMWQLKQFLLCQLIPI